MTDTATPRELWGAETRKAIENFPISGEPIPVEVARWLGRLKGASARANAELGLLDPALAERIASAADLVASGQFDDQFPLDQPDPRAVVGRRIQPHAVGQDPVLKFKRPIAGTEKCRERFLVLV